MSSDASTYPWPWLAAVLIAVVLMAWPRPSHELPADTPWHLLMQAEGLDGPSPILPDTLRLLVRQPIQLTGFMYPLEQSRGQRHFLLSPYPAGCAFHAPAGPTSTVEVFAEDPARFTYEPVAVQGVFALAGGEGEGLRYQLHAASVEELP
ncbi:MAG: DUF3299 domain-containing protein [Bacteroidota bacterium]